MWPERCVIDSTKNYMDLRWVLIGTRAIVKNLLDGKPWSCGLGHEQIPDFTKAPGANQATLRGMWANWAKEQEITMVPEHVARMLQRLVFVVAVDERDCSASEFAKWGDPE